MILYHGSNTQIDTIELSRCNRFKDFGQAFYLSADKKQAEEIAQTRADFLGGSPIVNSFEFDEKVLSEGILNYKQFPHYGLDWAQFVWDNRDEKRQVLYSHDYDIVYGPIMNDTIGFQMRKYRDSDISLREFLEGIKYFRGETYQYAFCTKRAIQYLVKL